MICKNCKQPIPASQIKVMYSDENRTALQANCNCPPNSEGGVAPTSYAVINQNRWMDEPQDDDLNDLDNVPDWNADDTYKRNDIMMYYGEMYIFQPKEQEDQFSIGNPPGSDKRFHILDPKFH